MNSHNKGYCYYCGDRVDLEDWEYIGDHSRVWVCAKPECHKELRKEQRYAIDELKDTHYSDPDR